MNLMEHTKIIKRWIISCEKPEQLDLCVDVIKEFVTKRFDGNCDAYDLMNAETDLANLIYDRRIVLAVTPSNTLPIGDNSRHDETNLNELI